MFCHLKLNSDIENNNHPFLFITTLSDGQSNIYDFTNGVVFDV